jgi:crossover junction endodeoxyribonuclease RuvC
MRILGIDPGTRTVGWGIVETTGGATKAVDYNVIDAKATPEYSKRFAYIHRELTRVILMNRPDIAVIEEVFTSQALKRSIEIGEGRGVAILTCALAGLPVESYSVKTVKKSVVGNGNADKKQVQKMVKLLLGLAEEPHPDDAADALAIAICHSHRCKALPAERAIPRAIEAD